MRARVVVASLVVSSGLFGWSAPTSAATEPEWQLVPAQTVAGESLLLNAVAVPTPGYVWVIGYHWEDVGGATEFHALAEHFNGTRFQIVATPDREAEPTVDLLEGASGTSASDLWAVGYSAPSGSTQTLVEHWNGKTWSIVASANPGSMGDVLEAVTALSPTDAWAVGARQNAGSLFQVPMAEHWTGHSWAAVGVPNPAPCTGNSYLTGVTSTGPDQVWATGWCGSGGTKPDQGYVVEWNGSHWVVAAARGVVPTNSQLYGISALGARSVWVVGFTQAPGSSSTTPLALHWNGTDWSVTKAPATTADPSLLAVGANPAAGTWAVGGEDSSDPPFVGPLSIHFAAGEWQKVSVPAAFGSLHALAIDSEGQVWAVGMRTTSSGLDVPLVVHLTVG